ncbi:MAG TPA: hypothetical protein VFX09_08485 [Burkholderiales bacterium]|nr:hypothetical protein [Burkholderiales bacterium]
MSGLRAAAFAAATGLALLQGCANPGAGVPVAYTVVENGDPASAQGTAREILRHLAAGELREAAALSNAPGRRYEVLQDYRKAVGDEEFRRVYAQYASPANRVVQEIALGERRLVIWQLGKAGDHLAGQFFVMQDGRFVTDDVPGEARSRLVQYLRAYRRKAKP